MLDALDRGLCEKAAEFVDREGEEISEAVLEDRLPGVESRLAGNLGEAVPWTGVEAIVTSVNAVADEWTEVLWNRPLVFDCEVGNTSWRIDMMRARNRTGRAGRHAGRALAAVVRLGWVGLEGEGGEQLGQKKPGAEPAMDLDGRLAIPAEAGSGGGLLRKIVV